MSIITLTEAAQEQINALCKENNCYAISLDVKGGGCAGFEYDWGIVNNEEDATDCELVDAGFGKLAVHRSSIFYLLGSEIDYVRSLIGAQFNISNPNAQSSCGCGVSVNFNDSISQFIG